MCTEHKRKTANLIQMPFGGRIILAQETLCEGGPDPLTGRGHIPALYKVQGLCIGRYVASMHAALCRIALDTCYHIGAAFPCGLCILLAAFDLLSNSWSPDDVVDFDGPSSVLSKMITR